MPIATPAQRAQALILAGVALVALTLGGLIVRNEFIFLLALASALLTALFIFRRPDLGFVILFACAFFFAPLKDFFHSSLTFFLVDLVIFVMAAFWFMQKVARGGRLFPRTALTAPILLMAGYSALLVFHPARPFLGSLAGYRAWNLGAVLFFLAYDFIDSPRALRRYFAVFCLFGLAVAAYGVYQEATGIQAKAESDPTFRLRHMGAYYSTAKGQQLRPFSTTVSAAELATSMAFLAGVALAMLRAPGRGPLRRLAWTGLLLLFLYVLLLTASRTVQISLGLSLVALAVLRRNLVLLAGLLVGVSLLVAVGARSLDLQFAERYRIFQRSPELRMRMAIPVQRAWRSVLDNPFGQGLGYTQGIPLHLQKSLKIETTNMDNGYGAALMEMGWVGLALYVLLLGGMVRASWRYCRRADPEDRPLMEAAFLAALATLLSCVAGNGLYGYPHALILWFVLGGAAKVAALSEGTA